MRVSVAVDETISGRAASADLPTAAEARAAMPVNKRRRVTMSIS
jgi:hypothetical protein